MVGLHRAINLLCVIEENSIDSFLLNAQLCERLPRDLVPVAGTGNSCGCRRVGRAKYDTLIPEGFHHGSNYDACQRSATKKTGRHLRYILIRLFHSSFCSLSFWVLGVLWELSKEAPGAGVDGVGASHAGGRNLT